MDACLLQPVGLPAISRGLSEATPPVEIVYHIRPRRGRSNRAKNLGALSGMPQMPGSGWWYPSPCGKNCDPSGVAILFGLLSGGVASLNPLRGLEPLRGSRNDLCITISSPAWEPFSCKLLLGRYWGSRSLKTPFPSGISRRYTQVLEARHSGRDSGIQRPRMANWRSRRCLCNRDHEATGCQVN